MFFRLLILKVLAWYLRTFNITFKRWPLALFAMGLSRKFGYKLGRRVVKTKHGFLMDLDLSDWLGQHVYVTGDYEDYTGRVLSSLISPGGTFLDVGANVGFFSLLASQCVGTNGKVIAFEPVPAVRKEFLRNLQINGIHNVVIREEAVSSQEGEAKVYVGPQNHRGTSSLRSSARGLASDQVSIHTIDLDSALPESVAMGVSVLKIDIEGAESLAVQGMRRLLESRHPDIIIEMSDHFLREFGSSGQDLHDTITAYGYRMYWINSVCIKLVDKWHSGLPEQFNALYTIRAALPQELVVR
ncbi:MAG: FkbM family methyltransferase [Planctomycetes bacterium]|nr:FkbM family methyltransferase [Planctomycetota bacterium]